MKIAHQFFQPLFQHVSVNLGRRNVGVTEQGLDHAQVRAVVQKVTGKSVSEDMRTEPRRLNSAGRSQRLELACEVLARQVSLLAERRK